MINNITRRLFLQHSAMVAGTFSTPGIAFANSKVDLSAGIDADREFVLAERPETPGLRDAVNVWIEEESGAFAMRLGVEAVAEEWDKQLVWLDIAFPDGRVLNLRDLNGPTHPALDDSGKPAIRGSGGARFQLIEPFKHWKAYFSGMVPDTTAAQLIHTAWPDEPPMTAVEFEIDMSMVAPPWQPGTMLDKNDDSYAHVSEFISPRYEQLFRCQGVMKIGSDSFRFSGNGLRIRRTGVRRLQDFWGHCWQSAVFPSGKAFGFNTFPPRDDGKPVYNEGFVFDGIDAPKPARAIQIPWMTEVTTGGDDVSCVLATSDGDVAIQGETFINVRSRVPKELTYMPDKFPVVQQAHAKYRWDGEESVGMVERSSLPNVITNIEDVYLPKKRS